jgi:epoxyqueuosine reductase QueG
VHPLHAPRRDGVDLLEVLGWSDADRARLVVSSALKRASLAMMRRNALLALASFARTGDTARGLVRERAERIACDDYEDDIVRAAARATLAAIDRMDATPHSG